MSRTLLVIALIAFVSGCGGSDSPTSPGSPSAPAFAITDLTVGSSPSIAAGQVLTVDFIGWLFDANAPENKGTLFDSTVNTQPFVFVLGVGDVIAGWDRGVAGMRVGGTRRLIIPPELGYGSQGWRSIPPNATLIFEIFLIAAI